MDSDRCTFHRQKVAISQTHEQNYRVGRCRFVPPSAHRMPVSLNLNFLQKVTFCAISSTELPSLALREQKGDTHQFCLSMCHRAPFGKNPRADDFADDDERSENEPFDLCEITRYVVEIVRCVVEQTIRRSGRGM